MKVTESDCVSCGLPCLGRACPHYEITYNVCDCCGDAVTLYHYDGDELCKDCIFEKLDLQEVE